MNIPSECRIASIGPNHAMILPHDANPSWMEFSEGTGMSPRLTQSTATIVKLARSKLSGPLLKSTIVVK